MAAPDRLRAIDRFIGSLLTVHDLYFAKFSKSGRFDSRPAVRDVVAEGFTLMREQCEVTRILEGTRHGFQAVAAARTAAELGTRFLWAGLVEDGWDRLVAYYADQIIANATKSSKSTKLESSRLLAGHSGLQALSSKATPMPFRLVSVLSDIEAERSRVGWPARPGVAKATNDVVFGVLHQLTHANPLYTRAARQASVAIAAYNGCWGGLLAFVRGVGAAVGWEEAEIANHFAPLAADRLYQATHGQPPPRYEW